MKQNAPSNEMLMRLEKTFILGKTDVDFSDQLKSLANVLLSETFSPLYFKNEKGENLSAISKKNILKEYLEITLKSFYNNNTQENMRLFIDNWAKCLIYINENFNDLIVLTGVSEFYSTSLQFRDAMADISKRKENSEIITVLTNKILSEIKIILQNNKFL